MSRPRSLLVPRLLAIFATRVAFVGGFLVAQPAAAQAPAARAVVINRVRIPDQTLQALEQRYGTSIRDGNYWYDAMSGAWGMEGGPAQGITLAGLNLGGPLRADASNGDTRVFVNGRELHRLDVLALQQIAGTVQPGRYWVDAQGTGGYEGGPAFFNLRVLAAQAAQNRSGLWKGPGAGVGENYGGGAWAYSNSNTGIGVISDGEGGMAVFDH